MTNRLFNTCSHNENRAGLRCALVLIGIILFTCSMYAQQCPRETYVGFDGRLNVKLAGRIPRALTSKEIYGFEVSNHRPIIAYNDRLTFFNNLTPISIPIPYSLLELAVDGRGTPIVSASDNSRSSRHSVYRFNGQRFVTDYILTNTTNGDLHASGTDILLESTGTRLIAHKVGGEVLPLFQFPEDTPPHAVSWNSFGLTAVVGQDLIYWSVGSPAVIQLASDQGFKSARDTCLIAPDRVIVALRNSVVLVTQHGIFPVVGMTARSRWDSGRLYLLDERGGFIWVLNGLDRLGNRQADNEYAAQLISRAHGNFEASQAFLEAERLVGCGNTGAIRHSTTSTSSNRVDDPSSWLSPTELPYIHLRSSCFESGGSYVWIMQVRSDDGNTHYASGKYGDTHFSISVLGTVEVRTSGSSCKRTPTAKFEVHDPDGQEHRARIEYKDGQVKSKLIWPGHKR